jgi:hypothetical protein
MAVTIAVKITSTDFVASSFAGITKRPRTQKEDEEALNANVVKKFIKEEE